MDTKLYSVLVSDIKNKIISGEMQPGERLPSETELLDIYNISKTTIAKSLQILANEGYIVTIPRVGNFVSKPHQTEYVMKFDPSELLKFCDHRELFSYSIERTEGNFCNRLQYSMLCKYEKRPAAVCENFILGESFGSFPEPDRIDLSSFMSLLETLYPPHSLKKKLIIEAVLCPNKYAEKLESKDRDTVMKITVRYYSIGEISVAETRYFIRREFLELHAMER
ncbi:MAG: GntR family transcriptional regulator [Anaerofustis sp.]